MTLKEKTAYLRIALALQHIGVEDKTAEQIIITYEKILEKGGKFDIDDAVNIEFTLNKKYIKEKLEK